MNRRSLVVSFYTLLLLSLLFSALTFIAWNMPVRIDIPLNFQHDIIQTTIDNCHLDEKRIMASGWSAPLSFKGRFFGKTFLAIKHNGNLFKIRTDRVQRPDLKGRMGNEVNIENSGFAAKSYYSPFTDEISNEIYVITEYEGKGYASKHSCNLQRK
nr:hypothetical protein [uncultured Enterobacter sp.]